MQISRIELEQLNFYRASELHGGLLLGQLVGRVRDPDLVEQLTRHSAEEVRHAQIWTETMVAVGGKPAPLRETYQRHLARAVGAPSSIFQVLALTQVFERRVYRHFLAHLRLPRVHEAVQRTLCIMIDEERHHLSWVKQWLDARASKSSRDLAVVLKQYEQADQRVYQQLVTEYQFKMAA